MFKCSAIECQLYKVPPRIPYRDLAIVVIASAVCQTRIMADFRTYSNLIEVPTQAFITESGRFCHVELGSRRHSAA